MRTSLRVSCLAIAAALLPAGAVVFGEELPMQTIAAVRQQVAQGTNNGRPVHVRGLITFIMPRLGVAFLQDETAGMAFYPPEVLPGMRGFKAGEVVEMTAQPLIQDGLVMLCGSSDDKGKVTTPKMNRLPGDAVRKIKPRRFDLTHTAQLVVNAELVQVSGVVRRVGHPRKSNGGGTIVEVSTSAGFVMVRLPWVTDAVEEQAWLDQEVGFTGVLVCRAEPRLLPEDADAVVFVAAPSDWLVRPQVMSDVFAKPLVTANQLIQPSLQPRSAGRIHVEGVVTAVRNRNVFFLRTADGSVEVNSRQVQQFAVGDRLSVACWPMSRAGHVVLVDAVSRSLGQEGEPTPLWLQGDPAQAKRSYGELISFQAVLRDVFRSNRSVRYLVALPDKSICAVFCEPPLDVTKFVDPGVGSIVQLTGISEIGKAGRHVVEGAHFSLRPRTLADLKLIKPAPWWHRQRLATAVWVLLAAVSLALAGALFLRWKLWRQEQKIRDIERRAASEEERRRIAREIHDSLQQQLASAALHMDSIREATHSAPHMLPALLDNTSALLRHCQTEARNCIWDLRSGDEIRSGITTSLRSWLGMRQRSVPEIEIHLEVKGDNEAVLPEASCFQALRIGQEAVNNAIVHSGATRVQVTVQHTPKSTEVIVEDNGKGFNTAAAPGAANGHFGLSMLQERARLINARVDLRSELERGTSVRLVVPQPTLRS